MKSKSYFTFAADGAKGAFHTAQKALGIQPDQDLALYGTLGVQDFEAIRNRYGVDGVARYVTAMERKKLSGGNNGSV